MASPNNFKNSSAMPFRPTYFFLLIFVNSFLVMLIPLVKGLHEFLIEFSDYYFRN
jgi:hypothetical protein